MLLIKGMPIIAAFVTLFFYLLLSILVWVFAKKNLAKQNLSFFDKLTFPLTWPVYLLTRQKDFVLKAFVFVFLFMIISVFAFDSFKPKVFSLQEKDLKETIGYCFDAKKQPANEMIRREINERKKLYIEAICKENPDEIIKLVKSPFEAATAITAYMARNGVRYNNIIPSMKDIHNGRKSIDCYGVAVIAASLLSDNGFQPAILFLRTSPRTFLFDITKTSRHAVYVYKLNGLFGYISLEKTTYPVFENLDTLINDVSRSMKVVYTQYFLSDLNIDAPNYLIKNSGTSGLEIWYKNKQADYWDYLL